MTDLPYHHDWTPEFETSIGMRVKWFGRWGNDPEWSVEPSRLASDLICFFYVESDSCTAVVNGAQVGVEAGDLLVIRGGDVFSLTQDSASRQTHLSACLSLSHDNEANTLLQYAYDRKYQIEDPDGYERRFYSVVEALKTGSRWRSLYVTAVVFEWLAGLQEALSPESSLKEPNSKTVRRVLVAQEWMEKRLTEDVSIADWSAACGLNVDYFSRLFKVHTGVTPRAWLIEARLQKAARMLAYQGKTVEQIASDCGFNCPFHFSRSFKRRFGLAPVNYRNIRLVSGFVDT